MFISIGDSLPTYTQLADEPEQPSERYSVLHLNTHVVEVAVSRVYVCQLDAAAEYSWTHELLQQEFPQEQRSQWRSEVGSIPFHHKDIQDTPAERSDNCNSSSRGRTGKQWL